MNNDTKPAVSVIVPVYNVERYIRNCLDSLLNQSFRNWEAILVDDGSPDHSGDICEAYAARDSRFKVVHKGNGGLSSARNAGLPLASGDYIFFLDSDDFLHPGTFDKLVVIATNTDADIVQCGFIRGQEVTFPPIDIGGKISIYGNHTIFTSFNAKIITCGKLYRRSVIGEIRFPEGLINEDDFTTWKFYYRAKRVVITPASFYYYTINPGSIMANQKRKPNLRYFDAYQERISFFQTTKEPDLEAISRVQWMKSLVMLYSNPQLSSTERKQIKQIFSENHKSESLCTISIPSKLRLAFFLFSIAPMSASKLINKLYRQ